MDRTQERGSALQKKAKKIARQLSDAGYSVVFLSISDEPGDHSYGHISPSLHSFVCMSGFVEGFELAHLTYQQAIKVARASPKSLHNLPQDLFVKVLNDQLLACRCVI